MVRMQFAPLDSSPADGCGWIVARRGRRPGHKVVKPISFVLFIDHHGRDLCVEVVEPIVDVPVEPVLLLLDQLLALPRPEWPCEDSLLLVAG